MRAAWDRIQTFLAETYLAPFRGDPRIGDLSIAELERRRRAQLLQLLLVTLTGVQTLSLFGQFASGAPGLIILAQFGAIGIGVVCYVLNRLR